MRTVKMIHKLSDGRSFDSTWNKKDFEENGFRVFITERTMISGIPWYGISKDGEGWYEIYFDGDTVIKIQEVGEFLDKWTTYKNKSLRYLLL